MTEMSELSYAEKIDWLRLIRSENIGPITFHQLIAKFGSATDALDHLPSLAQKGGAKRQIRICSKTQATKEFEGLTKLGGILVTFSDPHYPPLLREIHDPPPVLSCFGHIHLLGKESIGIVGSRNASAVACKMTERFARDLAQSGFVISSGLARGIDSAAHISSLDTGTIAVVGGGADVVYPKENQHLYDEIKARGCIIAEQPLHTQPQARHFPKRNRIISGLSRGVLVVEAAPRSGSLITARMASEQGREVFAVPGSPMDPRARGTNNLIRNGALLVESAAEMIAELQPVLKSPVREPDLSGPITLLNDNISDTQLDIARRELLILLGPVATEIDDLIRLSNQAPAAVLTILLELELAGRLERQTGNRVSLID